MREFLNTAFYWVITELTTLLGFGLAIVFIAHLIRQKRSPSSTLAWLLAIVLIPYIGVPLYILFGGRKMKRMAARKQRVYAPGTPKKADLIDFDTQRLLRSYGVPEESQGNRVEIVETGEEAYARLVEMIEGARSTLFIMTFVLSDDEVGRALIEMLTRKAQAGVTVRLLIDDVGSWWLPRRALAPLIKAGGHVAYFMPVFHIPFRGRANLRNHRKIAVADHRVAFAGGMNLTASYIGPLADPARWRDLAVMVEGPAVDDLEWLFFSDWKFATGEDLAMQFPRPIGPPHDHAPATLSHRPGNSVVQVVASGPDVEGDPLFESLLSLVFFARERIWILTPYFVPDEMLVRGLALAARRGVDVRLIVPWKSNHPITDVAREGYLRELHEAGASVLLYRPTMLHAKAVIFDDKLVAIGSPNMDNRSLFLNYEVALYIFSAESVAETARWAERLMAGSTVYEPKRGASREIAESVLRLVSPLL
ncbi:MAG: cardiolipin synthase [Paludisphaera borealis]|uniref:cardiolipin synthase n=1 Tax=Paludisphaera borealis TaxID=1387353 RepID=UPI00284296B8|nr:cardiolipin synthase [Paludisphaera borealis]MDR3620807.1 cardiolipin synthase [Paludisphaera borealis]